MKTKPSLAALAVLLITLWACTTTKDLERHPEFVAVAGTKEGAAPAAPENAAAAISAAPSPGGAATSPSSLGAAVTEPPTAGAPAPAGQGPTGSPAQQCSSRRQLFGLARDRREEDLYRETHLLPRQCLANTIEARRRRDRSDVARGDEAQGLQRSDDAVRLRRWPGYQVYTMPLRVTDVYLEPGEKLIEQPFCGDTTRWTIGGGVSKAAGVDTQHLYLKPSEAGLETTLIVNTDRRIYHLIIKSFKDTFMMAVMWHYPGLGVPLDFLFKDNEKTSRLEREGGQRTDQAEGAASAVAVDPGLLSSDYTVSYPKDHPPQWLPELVLDDGGKTYIVLPDTVIHHELPGVFGENGELVNFRVKDNVIVIDRLLRKMQLKLRDVTVEVRKKGA